MTTISPADLLARRERANLTRKQVADALQLNASTLWRYEQGKSTPRPEMVAALMRLYDLLPVAPKQDNDDAGGGT